MGSDFYKEMQNSYSGRSGFVPSADKVFAYAKQALDMKLWRDWVAKHHDVKKIVEQLC